jgi:hypothetical protein
MVEVMLAIFSESRPTPVRVGKVRKVPPPAKEWPAPATNASRAMTRVVRVGGG